MILLVRNMFNYFTSFNRYGNLRKRLRGLFFLHLQKAPIFAGHYQRPLVVKMGGGKNKRP